MGDVIEPPQMRERWLENARRDTPWIFAVVDCGLCDDYGYRGVRCVPFDVVAACGVVALRVSSGRCTLVETGMRRSWRWLWRKRPVTTVLASTPYRPKTGDIVTLTQSGAAYVVTTRPDVDAPEAVVLRWQR